MLVEFSGPSGVGKTTFCRHLLSSHPEWGALRRSTTGSFIHHRLAGLGMLGIREAGRFSKAKRQLRELSADCNDYVRRKLPSPGKLAIENMIYAGARHSSRVWLLDQGRFQLQSWLPRSVIGDQQRLASCLSEAVVFPDVLVVFRCSPPLVVSKLKARGDYCAREALARERGFRGLLEMAEYDFSLAAAKVQAALVGGSDAVLIDLDSSGRRPVLSSHWSDGSDPSQTRSTARRAVVRKLAGDLQSWWVPE